MAEDRTSPFDRIYIADGGKITVSVGDAAGELISVAGVEVDRLVSTSWALHGDDWKKRIAEDLPEILESITGKRPNIEVSVEMRSDNGTRRKVTTKFTSEKRRRIYASDYGAGGRGPRNSKAPQPVSPRFARGMMQMVAAHMESHWSYRHLRPDVDIEKQLRGSFRGDRQPTLRDLTIDTLRVMAMFPDGHAGVDEWRNRVVDGYLPAMTVWLGGDRIALMTYAPNGAARPVDENRPYLTAIGGRDLSQWLTAARRYTPQASSGNDWHAVEMLRYVPLLRRELGIAASNEVEVTVADEDRDNTRDVTLKLAGSRMPGRPRPWQRHEEPVARRLDGNVGYLKLAEMYESPEVLRQVANAMESFRDADGLVIDVRGNGGGSRLPLLVLWQYLADPGKSPQVGTLAKPLLGPDSQPYAELRTSRFMFPSDSDVWSDGERTAIAQFVDAFAPERQPTKHFGHWHYLVLGGDLNRMATAFAGDAFHVDQPVVVLMDGDCFSATSVFLAALAPRDDITLVGTPAASGSGRSRGHRITRDPDFGISLSTMASYMPDGRLFDTSVIKPDVEAWPSLSDLAGKTDSQLQKAVREIYERSEEE